MDFLPLSLPAVMRPFLHCIIFIFCAAIVSAAPKPVPTLRQDDIFVGGTDGYKVYRIPSLIVTKKKTLLAFCEGRKNGKSDGGDIDMLLKRSTDGGKTWLPLQTVWDDGGNTCGNPCPVVDAKTGTIWLLMTHNLGTDSEAHITARQASGSRTVWVSQSKNDGKTWSAPIEITKQVKPSSWTWYATGPGVGIQIQYGPHKGRLVIPCDYSETGIETRASHAIYSDDHGKTWKLGGVTGTRMNECQVVELADEQGTLLMDMRSYREHSRRAQSVSYDGGESWSNPEDHAQLVEPICQASILRYTWPDRKDRSRILFSNPNDEKRRRNMTVRLSYDESKTWPVEKVLYPEWSAYSCLAVLPDKSIACLYERGQKNSVERITFAHFSLEWLTDGQDSLDRK